MPSRAWLVVKSLSTPQRQEREHQILFQLVPSNRAARWRVELIQDCVYKSSFLWRYYVRICRVAEQRILGWGNQPKLL
jgi:hypothetical protein